MGQLIGRGTLFALVGLAIVAAIGSFLAEGNLAVALPLALIATCAAAAVAALTLVDRLQTRPKEVEANEPPPSVAVLDGLVGGPFARQTVLNDLHVLERNLASPLPGLTPEEEARILHLPRKEYLKWVADRVALLEART